MTSALTLYAYLRRYTLATIGAAELAANLAGVLKSNLPADDGGPELENRDEIPMARGMLLTLPAGYEATQFKPEQPITTYAGFKGEILTESGAGVGAPRNIATNSSAEYNYSSGRLDYGIYFRGLTVRREDLEHRSLDRVMRAYLDEAAIIPGMIPEGLPPRSEWGCDWFYDGLASLDPAKDAATNAANLAAGTTTLSRVFAADGLDWEEQLEQQAIESQRRAELGLATPRLRARRKKAVSA